MKKMKRIASAALSLVTVLGALVPSAVQPVSAAWADKVDDDGNPIIDYVNTAYTSAEDKLADMVLVKEENGAQIWFEEFTGEIAFVNTASGQILFSNPWDVAADYNKSSASTRQKLLSQLIIKYEDNGVDKEMYSYTDAALRGQITLKNIKNGVRVEYTIGEEKTTRLVPRLIEKSRFEELVLNQIEDDWTRNKVASFYTLKDPFDEKHTTKMVKEMQAKFPITKEMAVYVCDPDIKPSELERLEGYIKNNCPDYSYEELEKDHQMTNYEGDDAAPALFKLALEYTITADGDLEARLPANGIRYDESAFKLKTVTVLPYMGAGSNNYTGYTFIPDGSGTLIRFEDVKGTSYNVSGTVYGSDYAYHTIGNQHTEVMRWPVYGVVTNYSTSWTETVQKVVQEAYKDENGYTIPPVTERVNIEHVETNSTGFLAIITEGDSLASLMSEHGGPLHSFNAVYPQFTPRPSDQYNLSASMSVGSNTTWTVESPRKYTGSYRIVYKMLTDENIAEEKNLTDYYTADYMGMVNAYRDYLYENGTLTTLTDTTDDTPLYIETFGSMETTKRILSFPVTVDTPLTTFEDIKTMYNELTEAGVGRLNFRLTGYANGGMNATYPYHLNWVSVVGGDDGFTDLLDYANSEGFGVFPDFDFAYVHETDFMDGVSYRQHAVKTIDDRYTSKRYYDAATQTFTNDFAICISPSTYEHFYDKFSSNYKKFNVDSISVSTLGTDLNSDFDEDEPYNREDSKDFTVEVLEKIAADYDNVMIDGGNAYALPYADHIMKISTNSSQFLQASEAIPFMGMVLHGAKYFAGSPINMEGDIDSAVLKAIENGASLYFILSMQNTAELKDDQSLNEYYSVSYEIWKDEVVEYYKILNDATKDLQTSLIVDHEFLDGARVPDADELAADQAAVQAAKDAAAEAEAKAKAEIERQQNYNKLHGIEEEVTTTVETVEVAEVDTTSKYATGAGTIVRVEYEGNVNFILNYNSFDITVKYGSKTYEIPALGFVRIG